MPKSLPDLDMSAPICCPSLASGVISDEDALAVALRVKALADPVRLKAMSVLFGASSGESSGRDLAAALGIAPSTVSHHMAQLRNAGLVETRRLGMSVLHCVQPSAVSALVIALEALRG